MTEDKVVKTCGCSACYTREEFGKLPFVGVMRGYGIGWNLEIRMCSCGSSIAIRKPEEVGDALRPVP